MGYQDSDHASHYENLLKVVVKRRSVRRFETSGNGKTPTKSWADGKIFTSTRNRLTCAWPQPPFRRKSVGLGGTNGSRKCARRAARRWVSQVLNPSHALLCACCITISGVS